MFRSLFAPWLLAAVCISLAILGGSSPCFAQELSATDAESLIRSAFAKTKTAKTLAEYTAIASALERSQQADLQPAIVEYVNQLLSWTHNRIGELHADDAALKLKAGDAAAAEQADKTALEEFETAIALNPNAWKAIHNRGVSLGLQGKLEEAIADFTRAVELKPDYSNAWFNRGEIHFEQGQYDRAEDDYAAALRLKADDAEILVRRGSARFQLKKFGEALADFNRAVQLSPNNASAIAHRADAYRALGQWSSAAADFRRATSLDPTNSRAMQGAAWLMATCPEARYRDPKLALAAAERAIELLGEDDWRYLDTLAAAQASGGQFGQAVATATKAESLAPEREAASLQQRRELYEAKRPYLESP